MTDDTKALATRLRRKAVDSEDFAPESGAARYYREMSADMREAALKVTH